MQTALNQQGCHLFQVLPSVAEGKTGQKLPFQAAPNSATAEMFLSASHRTSAFLPPVLHLLSTSRRPSLCPSRPPPGPGSWSGSNSSGGASKPPLPLTQASDSTGQCDSTDSGAPEALLITEAPASSRGLLDLPAIALSLSAVGGGGGGSGGWGWEWGVGPTP